MCTGFRVFSRGGGLGFRVYMGFKASGLINLRV